MIKNGVATNTHLYVLETIKKLSQKKGYCWATNFTLGELLHITANRVSHVISDLVNAGLLARQLFFNDRGEVAERRLMARTTPLVKHDKEQVKGTIIDKEQGTEASVQPAQKVDCHRVVNQTKGKVLKMGYNLGIGISIVMRQIEKHGLTYVIEKLHIVASSNSAISNIKLFQAACRDNYQPSKKAQKALSDKPFQTRPAGYNTIVAPAPIAKAQPIDKSSTFLSELASKFAGKALGDKIATALA